MSRFSVRTSHNDDNEPLLWWVVDNAKLNDSKWVAQCYEEVWALLICNGLNERDAALKEQDEVIERGG